MLLVIQLLKCYEIHNSRFALEHRYIHNLLRGYTGNTEEKAVVKLWKCATKEEQQTMASSNGVNYAILKKNLGRRNWKNFETCARTVRRISQTQRVSLYHSLISSNITKTLTPTLEQRYFPQRMLAKEQNSQDSGLQRQIVKRSRTLARVDLLQC